MSELKTYNSERIYWAVEQVEQEAGDIDTLHLDDTLFYRKSDADKVIVELKDKCNMHDFFWDGCGFAKRGFKNTIAVSEAFDNLEAENRALKRALWLARANSAEGQFLYWCARFGYESGFTKADIIGYSVNTKRILRTIAEWLEYWENVKSKCLKKAEEYK